MNSEHTSSPVFRQRRVAAFRGCGAIYNWLRAHHVAVEARVKRGDLTWSALCHEMSRHGVTTRGGGAPNVKAVSKAWQSVCRDLAAAGAVEPPRRRPYPSRLPRDWRPAGAPGSAGPPATPRPASSDNYDPEKSNALLQRIINERSGRR
jgi:hypothetical protein